MQVDITRAPVVYETCVKLLTKQNSYRAFASLNMSMIIQDHSHYLRSK